MTNTIEERFRDKHILIWGYGREGKSTEAFFRRHPVAASVEISEGKPDEVDFSAYDYVFKSPGIRLSDPIRVDAKLTGKLTSQTELFIETFRERVIGITGTKGKSTTTSLLHHVLKTCLETQTGAPDAAGSAAGTSGTAGLRTAYLVGNIGVPCLDYFDEMAAGDAIAVFELSCHQLAYARVSPHWSIFLNLYEDHLDFYGDRKTYFTAKRHITEFQTSEDVL
ncbi:MAG: Mur ligase family protein, partial [Eubacterium sp.]|nr:Mur ligase family protein [Eubacterium sp.]